jgi:hypothetical protein
MTNRSPPSPWGYGAVIAAESTVLAAAVLVMAGSIYATGLVVIVGVMLVVLLVQTWARRRDP